jgi:hypothetical protein
MPDGQAKNAGAGGVGLQSETAPANSSHGLRESEPPDLVRQLPCDPLARGPCGKKLTACVRPEDCINDERAGPGSRQDRFSRVRDRGDGSGPTGGPERVGTKKNRQPRIAPRLPALRRCRHFFTVPGCWNNSFSFARSAGSSPPLTFPDLNNARFHSSSLSRMICLSRFVLSKLSSSRSTSSL